MRILVIGEKFIDKYYVGTTTRVSPEAPVPVVAIKEVIQLSGGAGNVAENLRALGAKVDTVFQPSPYPTKNRLMVGDVQLARWDEHDTADPITQLPLTWLYDGVVLSDYGKGAFTLPMLKALRKAVPYETPIFIDTKRSPSHFPFNEQAFFFPNHKEYTANAVAYSECRHVVCTMGADGMDYIGPDGGWHVPAKAVNVRSVNGAGDTVVAAFAVKYIQTKDILTSLHYAADNAADVVSQPLTSTPTHDPNQTFRPHHPQTVGTRNLTN